MNILITGGSGFVGGYVFRHFKKKGYSVKNFDISGDEGDPDFIKGSVLDFEAVKHTIFENDIYISLDVSENALKKNSNTQIKIHADLFNIPITNEKIDLEVKRIVENA